jgi:hypothetical protein
MMLAQALHSNSTPKWRRTLEQAQRNALLIAAAPDLLEALQGLLSLRAETDMTENDAYHAMFKLSGAKEWNAALAAIAKAKGETV